MFYTLEIFDSKEDYGAAMRGENYINSVTIPIAGNDNEEEAISTLKTAINAGKAVAIWTSDTPF